MHANNKKKVLVVDDSAFMRKVISDILNSHSAIEVVGVARNGQDALEKLEKLNPDVITLDVEMPIMNGIDALKKIMKTRPTPVVMLSSTTDEGAENTLLAMEYGAIDFIAKPGGAISLNLATVKDEIVEKVLAASTVQMSRMKIQRRTTPIKPVAPSKIQIGRRDHRVLPKAATKDLPKNTERATFSVTNKTIIAIGTSTGGPRALQEVLTQLPKNIKAPILIVQHMPAGFTKSLADRLNKLSEIDVKEVKNDDILKDGVAYIAPGGKHFQVRKVGTSFVAQVDDIDPPRAGHRPSVDVLFESISKLNNVQCLAVVMTGMGSDGMHGIVELKDRCKTIAIVESEDTSVVYGMPKSVVDQGLADEVVRLEHIADTITEIV